MSLPKELTTVTPVSKCIAVILAVFLPILGFFLGIRYQEMLTVMSTNNPGSPHTGVKLMPISPTGEHTDWQEVDVEKFTISTPPGWQYVKKQGIDSFIGEITDGKMTLHFDYGWYSTDFSDLAHLQPEIIYEQIDQRHSMLIRATDQSRGRIAGIYIENVTTDVDEVGVPIMRFSMYGDHLTPDQQALAWELFRTLRFP